MSIRAGYINNAGGVGLIEKVIHDDVLLAIIMRSHHHEDDVTFLTPSEAAIQLGYMNHPAGHRIRPHYHPENERNITRTQEVIFIKQGRVRVDLYNDSDDLVERSELNTGDWIILLSGGHGFEMIDPTIMIEVKTGPYSGDRDKIHYSQ